MLNKMQAADGVKRPLRVVLDCATRWWSTYTMLERALDLRRYIERLFLEGGAELKAYRIAAERWDVYPMIEGVLAPFAELTRRVEASTRARARALRRLRLIPARPGARRRASTRRSTSCSRASWASRASTTPRRA